MSGKRSRDRENENSIHKLGQPSRKRRKMKDARNINVQPATSTSHYRLPDALDVDKFVQTRAYEIKAMEDGIKSAKKAGAQRAFQSLPRHLRRRAASHNLRRLPLRLRAKAATEMASDNTKGLKTRKIRKLPLKKKVKRSRLSRKAMLQLRATKKNWLETHLWHAKRFKMVDKWGQRLALTPTEKSFRPSYRAAMHGCLLHDASYMSTISVKGQKSVIQALLINLSDVSDISPKAARFCDGSREATTVLYNRNTYPTRMIGPARIIWKGSDSSDSIAAQILLIIHPTMQSEVYDNVLQAVSDAEAFATVLTQNSDSIASVPIVSIPSDPKRTQIDFCKLGIFELTGSKSAQILSSVLKEPKKSDYRVPNFLACLANGEMKAIPDSLVYNIHVEDPRLSFPPKKEQRSTSFNFSNLQYSDGSLRNTGFWKAMNRDNKPIFSKKQLDARRAEINKQDPLKTRLMPLPEDDEIDVIVIKRSLQSRIYGRKQEEDTSQCGFTLLVPQHFGNAFWMSLVYSSARVGGLVERKHQDFEACVPSFPYDWPFTKGGENEALQISEEHEKRWKRTPPAKRTNFKKVGTVRPFLPDWKLTRSSVSSAEKVPTPTLLRGRLLQTFLRKLQDTTEDADLTNLRLHNSFYDQLCHYFGKRLAGLLHKSHRTVSLQLIRTTAASYLECYFVNVVVKPVGRGTIENMAALYRITDRNNLQSWMNQVSLPSPKPEDWQKDWKDLEKETCIIGWISTGNFSLRGGHPHGIGTVSFNHIIEDFRNERNERKSTRRLIMYKNPQSRMMRPAHLEIMY